MAALALQLADGERAVAAALHAQPLTGPVRVLAMGKAAAAMWRGAAKQLIAQQAAHPASRSASWPSAQLRAALIIAPAAMTERDRDAAGELQSSLTWLVGAHPLPDERSLQAGIAAQQFVAATAPGEQLLVLLSGGASALCEVPVAGVTLAQMQAIQQQLLASALPIVSINAIRQRLSQIKAGGLARQLQAGVRVRQLLLSDVPGDDLRVIGSAPFIASTAPLPDLTTLPLSLRTLLQPYLAPTSTPTISPNADVTSEVIASNQRVRMGLGRYLEEPYLGEQHINNQELPLVLNQSVSGELSAVAALVTEALQRGPAGYYLFGGETHLQLPAEPGRGGRNQQLALTLALRLRDQHDLSVMTLATDGVDGNSDAAGALFHAGLAAAEVASAQAALSQASSYDYWRSRGGLLVTGATGSNVADLILACKQVR